MGFRAQDFKAANLRHRLDILQGKLISRLGGRYGNLKLQFGQGCQPGASGAATRPHR